MQSKYGARFFILKICFPPAHEYHISIKKLQKLSGEIGMCPICYGRLDEDQTDVTGGTVSWNQTGNGNLEPFNNYKRLKKCMMTPCNHFYHPGCLTQWMDQKMECPTCRAQLPPY